MLPMIQTALSLVTLKFAETIFGRDITNKLVFQPNSPFPQNSMVRHRLHPSMFKQLATRWRPKLGSRAARRRFEPSRPRQQLTLTYLKLIASVLGSCTGLGVAHRQRVRVAALAVIWNLRRTAQRSCRPGRQHNGRAKSRACHWRAFRSVRA
jgi:hypothetical protein